jgi:hypothetical protein
MVQVLYIGVIFDVPVIVFEELIKMAYFAENFFIRKKVKFTKS